MPLRDAEEVFLAAAGILGDRLMRVPDGETGTRSGWIGWQAPFFQEGPYFVPAAPAARDYGQRPRVRLRPGVTGADVHFGQLGYALAARRSYALFARLRDEGRLPAHYRFQVSLPTGLAVAAAFVAPEDAPAVAPAYTARLLEELAEISQSVPPELLAVQWDVAVEFAILEGVLHGWRPGGLEPIVDQLVGLGQAVPREAELGYHLCYGDYLHQHFKQPEDTRLMVEVSNGLAARLPRPLNWVHLPVPRDRADEAYLAPLRHRQLRPETELYLGLVHMTDGYEGGLRRLDTARRTVDAFGVSTECGMGRRPPETIRPLLELLAKVSGA